MISCRIDSFALLAVCLKSLLPHCSSKASVLLYGLSLLYGPALTSMHDCWKDHSFDYMDFYQQSDVLSFFFNMLSSFVIAFLPRSKRLLIPLLQSLSAVILEPSLSLLPLDDKGVASAW